VSLGRKPSPGGETKVWRMLERMVAGPPDLEWRIKPTPSLLAEPSRPRAIILAGRGEGVGWDGMGGLRYRLVAWPGSGPGLAAEGGLVIFKGRESHFIALLSYLHCYRICTTIEFGLIRGKPIFAPHINGYPTLIAARNVSQDTLEITFSMPIEGWHMLSLLPIHLKIHWKPPS